MSVRRLKPFIPACISTNSTSCIEPGCPALTTKTRCTAHAYQQQRQRDLRRGTPSQRGYDYTYQRNREIVPRREHAVTVLEAGDRLEIVTFVGGG